jgi:TolB-like protein
MDCMAPGEVSFGEFRLDPRAGRLLRNGRPLELKSKAFDILCVLACARGQLVTKDELMAKVWPGVVVEENNIQVHVSALRKALGEDRGSPVHLLTVAGRGYRLVGVEDADALPPEHGRATGPAPVPERASIAVLPFLNLSDDPQQAYFGEGIVEDIITGLSRVKWLAVISRGSSQRYKGADIDVRQVGRDLAVRYVLQGTVRRSAERIRITAQLVEASSGVQAWAERYDRVLGDIFELQDEISMSVIGAIEPGLRKIEVERVRRKRPEALDAYDLVLRALPFMYKLMPATSAPAIPLLQRALALEPGYAVAHAILAWCFHVRFSRGGLHEEDRRAAIEHARLAVSGASDDPLVLAVAGLVTWFEGHDAPAAFDLFDRALALSNCNVLALCTSAVALAWSGQSELAIQRAQRALQLSPFDALNYLSYQALAGANFHLARYELACAAAQRAVELNPQFSVPQAYLAASLVALGRDEEARAAARTILELDPGFTIGRFGVTVGLNPDVFGEFAQAWRRVGLPE